MRVIPVLSMSSEVISKVMTGWRGRINDGPRRGTSVKLLGLARRAERGATQKWTNVVRRGGFLTSHAARKIRGREPQPTAVFAVAVAVQTDLSDANWAQHGGCIFSDCSIEVAVRTRIGRRWFVRRRAIAHIKGVDYGQATWDRSKGVSPSFPIDVVPVTNTFEGVTSGQSTTPGLRDTRWADRQAAFSFLQSSKVAAP